jgi:hypothetical protein
VAFASRKRAGAKATAFALVVEPDDRLARRACGDGGCSARRAACVAQGTALGFEVAAVSAGIPLNLLPKWPRPAQHDGDLRRRQGDGHCATDVGYS